MEKGKLEIIKTKKGEYVVNIVYPDGKKQTISDLRLKDNSLNGKQVDVIRDKGQIIKIIHEGKEIYSKEKNILQSSQRQQKDYHIEKNHTNSKVSKAPYNFIPLNERVVPAHDLPDFDRYHLERYTGYIELEIKARTPLYIRDTLTQKEYEEKLKHEKKLKNEKEEEKIPYINPDFFSPGGLLRIPGSSLRGMIRTMVEIMSFGKFLFFEDARLYYRGLADRCKNLRDEYREKIKHKSAGVLYKKGYSYFIKPSKNFSSILKSETKKLIQNKGYTYFYSLDKGYIIVSGDIGGKRRDWFIESPEENAKEIKISDEDIANYKNDRLRSKNAPDLLKLAKSEVPCFYTKFVDLNGKQRIAFGHTAFFRIPYEKTIGDHIIKELKNPSITDLAEAIFGNEKTHAGRVYFEDCYLEGTDKDALLNTDYPKILSNPKPTCFQHYLEQTENNLKEHPKILAHYNSSNPIRGYKLYWHRSGKGWIEDNKENIEKHKSQYTRITPVKEGSVFKGRIRFENLSDVELGALLFALDLPEGLAHKLGMAKPLGLGSVRITPKLYISDRKKRYEDLFFEWEKVEERKDTETFKKAFESYILKNLNSKEKSIWEIYRMKLLKRMLDFNGKPNDEQTEYLKLEEFRERRVLPTPDRV